MSEHEPTQADTMTYLGTGPPPPSREPLRPGPDGLGAGLVIDERLRLDEKIGAGAMGEVWRARHLGLDANVAIKFVAPELRDRATAMERFWLEARTMGRLGHRNVIRVLDTSGPAAQIPYIVMELLEGESLAERVDREEGGRLGRAEAIHISEQILAALGEAHRHNIIHRDIKPANVFLATSADAGETVAKVLDFGASKLVDATDQKLTKAGMLVGTPLYMSPEQASGEPLTGRSDLYALAVVFYELLSGRLPHEADELRALIIRRSTVDATPIRRVVPEIPQEYSRFFDRALARDPQQRFEDADAMREAMLALPRPDSAARSEPKAAAWGAALDAALAGGAAEESLVPVGGDVAATPAVSASMSVGIGREASSVSPATQVEAEEARLELDHAAVAPAAHTSTPAWVWVTIAVISATVAYGVWNWRAGDGPTMRPIIDAALAFGTTFVLGVVVARTR